MRALPSPSDSEQSPLGTNAPDLRCTAPVASECAASKAHGEWGLAVHRFSHFELDLAALELRRAGQPLPISIPSIRLLAHLIRRRPATVMPEELLRVGWEDSVVTPSSLRVAIHELRQALGDTEDELRFIKTVRGRGYRFVGALVEEPSRRTSFVDLSLCGREAELSALCRCVEAGAQCLRVAVLLGPPGVGKTRLAREALRVAESLGFACGEGQASADEPALPFALWRRALAARLAHCGQALQQRYAQRTPLAYRALTVGWRDETTSRDDLPEQLRSNVLVELRDMVLSMCEEQPLAVLLDDLHLADEASIALFARLTREPARSRLLVLATCRPLGRREDRALLRSLDVIQRTSQHLLLELDNLSVAALGKVLSTAGVTADEEQALRIHALTSGNPLFSLEVAMLLRSTGDAVRVLDEPNLELQTVIRRRLSGLPSASRALLLKSSVLGLDFALAEIAAVLDCPARDALAELDACLAHGLLLQLPDQRFGFGHSLVRDVCYAELSVSARRQYHLAVATWLEQREGIHTSAARLAQLAHHAYRAAPLRGTERAQDYLRGCAEHAMSVGAHQSAVTYYDQAIECADLIVSNAEARLELEIERAEALRAAGSATCVNSLLHELAERASALGQPRLLAQAALAYSGQHRLRFSPNHHAGAVDQQEAELLTRALTAIGPTPSEQRVLLLCSLAWSIISTDQRERRDQLSAEAIANARILGIPWLLARALMLRVFTCAAPDEYDERIATCNELVDLASLHGLRDVEAEVRVTRAFCRLERGDVEGADLDEERARTLSRVGYAPRLQARADLLAIARASSSGLLDEMQRLSRRALARTPNDLIARAFFLVQETAMRALRDGVSVQAIAIFEALAVHFPHARCFRCALSTTYAFFGDHRAALEQFDLIAADDFRALSEDVNWLGAMTYLAETASMLDDCGRARLVYRRLLAYEDRWYFYAGEAVPGGPVARWLGELAITMGDGATAERWLRRSAALCQRMNAPLFARYNDIVQARRIFVFGVSGERRRAHQLLDEASGFAHANGIKMMHPHIERVRALDGRRADNHLRTGAG